MSTSTVSPPTANYGIHLTEAGQWATRLPMDPALPSLYGWDCESTLWFKWAFSDVADLGVLTAVGQSWNDDEEIETSEGERP